jgi:RNA ligase (TIGR02306 family)
MTERKLATIRQIDQLIPIQGADFIELARIGGWDVVVKKGQFKAFDLAIYIEIDSWVPLTVAPFLAQSKERKFNDIVGERLRTKRLKGIISQGLLLDLIADDNCPPPDEGTDLTEYLGIQLYEKPIPACLTGLARGNFPSFIPKTDQERVQNLKAKYSNWQDKGTQWEVTEKLDGSSMTVYQRYGEFGVCSRNLDLKETEGNTFWQVTRELYIENKMFNHDRDWDFAIQGELCGPGIQGNQYNLSRAQFFVYDIFNIQTQKYLLPPERRTLCKELGLNHVPVIWEAVELNTDITATLQQAQGESELNGTNREGLVFKSLEDTNDSFKAINNEWLLKNE